MYTFFWPTLYIGAIANSTVHQPRIAADHQIQHPSSERENHGRILIVMYRGADESLARPRRRQANASVIIALIAFGALPRKKKNKLDDSSRLDVVKIARVPDMLPRVFPSWSGQGLISTPVHWREPDYCITQLRNPAIIYFWYVIESYFYSGNEFMGWEEERKHERPAELEAASVRGTPAWIKELA